MTTPTLHLPPPVLERLAAGGGGATAVQLLQQIQVSRNLLLIRHLLDRWPGDARRRVDLVTALDRARAADPDRFRQVVGAPAVAAWAAILGRAVDRDRADPADFEQFATLAMVACARCGVDASAEVATRDGAVSLPGVGTATVDGPTATVAAAGHRLTVRGTASTIEASTVDGPGWQAVRYLTGSENGPGIRLALDDLDPYRHGHHAPPAPRLAPAEVAEWQRVFAATWTLLTRRIPERAEELAAGLRVLIPLHTDSRAARSATIRHVFGAFGLTRPTSAPDFAVTLVHEFQHSKLSALLDVVPLTDPDDDGRYFAPWRTDARPLAGLLQGVYAFIGVADTWRALIPDDPTATARFAEARLQADHGLAAIERSGVERPGAVTPTGRAFLDHLRQTADRLLAEPVPEPIDRAARKALDDLRTAWIARNGTPS
ncbi:aKG-HExxH-type peptide beta-hydroxylase [Virgisporangium aurantiacum]|uniref:HEXXH motif domain-containing protein n=1 Tax=Virgisporangium aurantiacum TaxID=175570 RepID=A0A8J3Z0Y5_9ACTN|nr:HEXXH motif-containing putative peptide modification protein [Virgisporangium aurantiacum]GIJ53310.1 HEXXH motif domain-containing protein [Virgisporangium aurantiacum]